MLCPCRGSAKMVRFWLSPFRRYASFAKPATTRRSRMTNCTGFPFTLAGWTLRLLVNDGTSLQPASAMAVSATVHAVHYNVQLAPGRQFTLVWHGDCPQAAPSVARCWMQEGETPPMPLRSAPLTMPQNHTSASGRVGERSGSGVAFRATAQEDEGVTDRLRSDRGSATQDYPRDLPSRRHRDVRTARHVRFDLRRRAASRR